MLRPAKWIITLCIVAAAGLAGCNGMQYNGAWTLPGAGDDDLAAYQQYLKDRDLAQAAIGQTQAAHAQPDMMGVTGRMPQTSAPQAVIFPDSQTQPIPGSAVASSGGKPIDRYGQFASMPQHGPAVDQMGGATRMTFTTEGADFDPEIDPTGQWLVFASTRHNAKADIYYKRTDSAAVTQLTSDPGNDVMPAVSPDGNKIAFASDRSGNWDIYMMDAAGGQPVQLTNDPAHEIHPSFAPDGGRIVYSRFGEQSGRWELVVVDLANPSTKRFIGYGLFPAWSPSGDRIVFQRARERGTRWFSIWTIEMINGEAMRPTEVAASANAATITPAWSPDGKQIVFSTILDVTGQSDQRPSQADIWMVDIDGRNRINLTHSQYTNLQPTWSSDGTIYFASNRAGHATENVWALRPDRARSLAQSTRDAGATRTADNSKQQWPTGFGSPASKEAAVYVDPESVQAP